MKSGKRMKILLVEDMAIIAMSEAAMLKKNGFDVIIANTGEQAIKIANENPNIDLILMDIDLGKGIDGTEAAQKILHEKDIPIVFLSNHTEKEIVDKTEKITSYGYVVKNSGETVLIASIKMAFKLFDAHTKRLESEIRLLESDSRFHILEKQIDDVIWTMDMNFRFTYISPSVEKLHGYTVDEMMKLNPQDYLPPEAAQKIIEILGEHISNYLANKNALNNVTIILNQVKKDGTIFPTEIKARFLVDNEDKPIGIIGVTRDITERLKAEEALLESKTALDLVLEGAQIGFWDSNYNTGKVIRSKTWAAMLGYTLEEVENSPEFWRNHIHPDDFDNVMEEVRKHEDGKIDNFSVEHRIRTKSGKYKWIMDWGKVFERSETGKPIRAMGVHIDIDNKIRTENDLVETNKTLSMALEGAQIGLWDQDFKKGTVKRTTNWAKMLGYNLDEITEELDTWKSLLHPDDYDVVVKAAKDHERGLTEDFKVQHRLKCKDGSYKWILNWGKISERDKDGNPIRAVGIHLDIDEQIKTEDALKLSEERLRFALDGNTDGIWDWNLITGEVYFSPRYYTMLGYQPNEFLPGYEKWKELLHPDDIEKANNQVLESIEQIKPFLSEFRLKKKDGSYCWILARGKVAEVNSEGKAIRITGSHTDINDRKFAELELQESRQMLSTILNNIPIRVFWKDKNSNYLGCNLPFALDAGFKSPEELYGKTDFDMGWTNEAELYRKDDLEVISSDIPRYNYEEPQTRANNEVGWLRTSKVPLKNLNDEVIGILGTYEDITERKKTEEQLKKSEERYALAQKAAKIGSWDWNMITDELSWSEIIRTMFGFNEGEFSGKISDFWKRLHPDDISLLQEKIKATIERNEEYYVEHRIIRPDGEVRWVLEAGNVVRDKNGNPARLLGVVQDITNRKEIEQSIIESKEKYRRFFEEDLSGIFLSTPEGKMKACNPAYVKMMEYDSEEEILATNTTTHYEQPQSRVDFLNLLREKRKLINYEGSIVTKSGKVIQTLENIIGVFDKNNTLIEFWGYVNDITDRKKAEAILKKSAEEKEALHRELLHRVKNSFNLVKSLIFLEREKLNESKASLVLEKIEMRVNALGKMYSLLNLSGTSQQIDLGAYLNEITLSLVNSYIQDSKRIDVKTNFDSIITSPKTASSVGLILNELLTNSLKYAFPENRSGIIHVGLRAVNGNAEIKIADNGIGVPEDFKIEDSSGMGLQLVNMLVLQLNGTIEVDKKLGTSFRIVFPLNE